MYRMYMKMISDPAANSSNITIRLIRNTKITQKDTDDIITIHHKGENIFHVFYKDGNADNCSQRHMSVLDGDGLDTYLYGLFTLVGTDRDAFKLIQFNIPTFPALMYQPCDLTEKKIRSKLMHLMPILKSAIKVYVA